MADAPKNQEFHVAISGLDLTPEHVERINRAVRTAVMTEIASLDFPESMGILFPRPPILGIIFRPFEGPE
jgi:hypothetical protein